MQAKEHAKGLLFCAVLLATVAAPRAVSQTLGDTLREHDWERIVGTWVDEETGGQNVKVTYAWRLAPHVLQIDTWTPREQTVGFMARNAQNGDIFHAGATSTGGSNLGKWEIEDGDAVLNLGFTTGTGEQGGLSIRHHLEDDNTLVITFQGPEPTVIRMARDETPAPAAAPPAGPEPGPITEVAGPTTVRIESRAEAFDANHNLTVEEAELEQGFLGIMERYENSRAKLVQVFDADADGALGPEESEAVGAFLFGLAGALPFDSNRDWTLDETEADQAWARLADQCQRYNDRLLRRFDRDQDGQLNETERRAARGQNAR